jgi:photosynthetic reaction center cytochrome c subunit
VKFDLLTRSFKFARQNAAGHGRNVPTLAIAGIAAVVLLAGCERPPIEQKQNGFRGTGMDTNINPRIDASKSANNEIPVTLPEASPDGPLAASVYQNVQVLKDLSVGQFTRVMLAMNQWVAPPEQSCNYCHGANMASDERYTKVVARRMLQMVRYINTDWKDHVGKTGVTCYTCHRGHAVPQNVWFESPTQGAGRGLSAGDPNLYSPHATVGDSSLPYDPDTEYLLGDRQIRVIGEHPLPDGVNSSIQHTEVTYALMMQFSQSLGVNCTYCHNSRSFAVWDQSTPKRTTAWYGIRMVRNINNDYLVPLTATFPTHRLGVLGDVAKVSCATCHQGLFKPLYGVSMLKDYPELKGPYVHEPPATEPVAPPAPGAKTTSLAPAGAGASIKIAQR